MFLIHPVMDFFRGTRYTSIQQTKIHLIQSKIHIERNINHDKNDYKFRNSCLSYFMH